MASTLEHFVCVRCDATVGPSEGTTARESLLSSDRCGECGGSLYARYDSSGATLAADGTGGRGIWRFESLLPPVLEDSRPPVTLGEGDTPLVSCPPLAESAGVGALTIQDDGRSTTASGLADRGASVVTTAARERDVADLVLASTGSGAVALAAYAASADPDLDVHAFVPARAPFAHKALFNVHGGDMRVVGGRYDAAVGALADARADESDPAAGWTLAGPAATTYWVEGAKTAAFEALTELETPPTAVVCPVGHGVALAGWWRGLAALAAADRIETPPRLYGVQAGGCAPVVDAVDAGLEAPEPVGTPDSISGSLEVPEPAVGDLALRAIAETGGDAVAVTDEAILEAGVTVSRQIGLQLGTPGAAAVAGVDKLAETGAIDSSDRVLVYNPTAATPEADLFRSHLMRRGE